MKGARKRKHFKGGFVFGLGEGETEGGFGLPWGISEVTRVGIRCSISFP